MYNLDKEKLKEIPKKMEEMNEKIADGLSEKLQGKAKMLSGALVLLLLLGLISALSIIVENPISGLLGLAVLFGLVTSPLIVAKMKKVEAAKEAAKEDSKEDSKDESKDESAEESSEEKSE